MTLPEDLWRARDDEASLRPLYDGWADRYDADMAESGTLGPARAVDALARFVPDRDAAIVDFGCGTGAAGAILAERGYARLSGIDLSSRMLARARARGVYRDLTLAEPDAAIAIPADVAGVVASGSICVGAAPAPVLERLLRAMPVGAVLVTTYNDDTLRDAAYMRALADVQADGLARLEWAEYGPQLTALNRGATAYVLRRA